MRLRLQLSIASSRPSSEIAITSSLSTVSFIFFSPSITSSTMVIISNVNVKLNLFNYVLALFRVKFACNSAFRNSVFLWE